MAAEAPGSVDPDGRQPRPPTLLDAILPVVVLIALIALTIVLFGVSATDGPLQVALLLSAAFAALIAFKNGYTVETVAEAAVSGISSAIGAIFILLAVGALIGTWNMAGTIPTVVDYGIRLLNPNIFFFATAAICAIVGVVTGSSWTTAGTLGVAFVGMATVLGLSEAAAAGAVICGAYFGDKMTPLSETTVLVPSMVGGVTVNQHVGAMAWSSGPAIVIAIVLFAILGLTSTPAETAFDTAAAQATLAGEFNITPLNLLPLVLLVILSIRRVPSFLSIFSCALFAGVLAWFSQPELVQAFVGGTAGTLVTDIKALYQAMANGFVSNTGVPQIDQLFSRGGMSSMLSTIWLVIAALSYASIVEHAGFLSRLIEPLVTRAKSDGALVASVIGTAIGLNILAGDQYVAIVMPSRVYRLEFARRRIAPRTLSRTVEDSGTVTSPLVPWNSCGAYMAGVLGVATVAYLPYCFFNLASPVISLLYGFTGFRIEHLPPEAGDAPALPEETAAASDRPSLEAPA
jgi:Na+:H+ antiporter, NhaC family